MTKAERIARFLLETDILGPDGNPLTMYRGFRRVPKGDFRTTLNRATTSFTPVKEIANVYAATRDEWSGTPDYKSGANVGMYYLTMKRPLDLRGLGTRTTLWNVIDQLSWDFQDTASHGKFSWDNLSEVIESFLYDLTKIEYEVEFSSSADGVGRITDWEDLLDAVNELSDQSPSDGNQMVDARLEKLEYLLDGVDIDTYVLADNAGFVDACRELGYDGIIHRDTFQAGAEYLPKFAGRQPEEIEGLDVEDDYSFDCYRPFTQAQIRPWYQKHAPGDIPVQDVKAA